MGQELHQGLVSHTTLHYIGRLMGPGHDLDPRLVNVAETFGFLFGAETIQLINACCKTEFLKVKIYTLLISDLCLEF